MKIVAVSVRCAPVPKLGEFRGATTKALEFTCSRCKRVDQYGLAPHNCIYKIERKAPSLEGCTATIRAASTDLGFSLPEIGL